MYFDAHEIDTNIAFIQSSKLEVNQIQARNRDFISTTGWIGNSIGSSQSGLKVQLSYMKDGAQHRFDPVYSDENGYFTFEALRTSKIYELTVLPSPEYLYYVDEAFTAAANSQPFNIILESIEFVDIDGMIVNNNSIPIPDFDIYISNLSTGTHVRKISSDSSGFFSLRRFPAGEVELSTQGPDNIFIDGITLVSGEYRILNLIVDKGDYFLSGWLSDENGLPITDALIVMNGSILDGPIEYKSYRVTGTDNAGNFSFENLSSGRHEILVKSHGYYNKEVIHEFESRSDRVHIMLSSK